MSNNKESKKTATTYNLVIYITIVLAALKLDGHLNIPWVIVVSPVLFILALGVITAIIALITMSMLGIIKIRNSIKENSYGKHLYNKHASGTAIHWDYRTQSFYDAAGNKIDNTIEDEEEQD